MDAPSREIPITIGPEWDYLSTSKPQHAIAVDEPPSSDKCALIATVRDEGLTLIEWIAHNRVLGFGQIFIYSNDNRDGSDELLETLHQYGIIHLTWNIADTEKIKIQPKVYRHALWFQSELRKYKWLTILDADEFIFPTISGKVVGIDEYLANVENKYRSSQVSLRWRWFAGPLEFSWKSGLLMERFQASSWHYAVKSIFKIRDVADAGTHFCSMRDGAVSTDCFGNAWTPNYDYTTCNTLTAPLGQVNHYWERSFQEYFIKRQRGLPGTGGYLDWDKFFKWKTRSHERSPYPEAAHIDKVKAEMNKILSMPGVKAIVDKIERGFKKAMLDPTVLEIYERMCNSGEQKS